ncbi:protein kinase family protein [Blastococcus sp. TML/M2B]|uniref:protein kinase family protein n=1 Tax=unclassified Blastococcus TaxID=2619396 RepID=UPI0019091383|nr:MULTISPECIES: protein kinase family protein [unclassified Blastococcus]MBN1094484.1 protein kinase family protein [Blastococcus sp. TML/M2B]MBN1095441.1 protein kinase family protein [Blastococcus sp. TML/C7B]
MTSTVTGLPDRYRPLDQVGPDEQTETGVIQTWRAKDRILNRDVAVRVHTPAGPAAHAWITRALTAGGLATPALAMVYDASEGSGDPQAPGGAAYVVNEWIDGVPLAERLAEGPLPEREIRTVLRRLADGVAEAHRVGLAVGGLTPDNVVLRPNGLVGLRGVPAASGSIDGDVAALGALLEVCLTGLRPGEAEPRPLRGPSDLVALARRARSTEPGQALSSVAAMAAILADRPRTRPGAGVRSEQPWGDRQRPAEEQRPDPVGPSAPGTVPPVRPPGAGDTVVAAAVHGDTVDARSVPPVAGAYAGTRSDDRALPPLGEDLYTGPPTGSGYDDEDDDEGRGRRRLLVVGLPLLALLVVIGLAWWVGTSLLSVAGSVDEGSTPSISVPTAGASGSDDAAPAGPAATVQGAEVFDPEGDGEPENDGDVPLTYDGDPGTTWSTVTYRGSAAFGNLKSGMGIVYDLGSSQPLAGVTVTTPRPGATVEIRTADTRADDLDGYEQVASGTLQESSDLRFDEPVQARYVLLWITGLVESGDGFTGEIGEVTVQAAG